MNEVAQKRPTSRNLYVLRGLFPFIKPYKMLALAALGALIVTASLSLVLPIAVRQIVDNFGSGRAELLDAYFAAAFIIVGILALGTGLRYYLVTRLGEEVIADIRRAVFDRAICMSPSFFEKIMTGEVLSRLNTDTTLILSVIGSSASIALRNLFIFIGGLVLLLLTSAKLAAIVFLIAPAVLVPIVVLGRKVRVLSRINQDWIARSSGTASETLRNVQAVQAYSQEEASSKVFSELTREYVAAARQRISARALMTVIVIFLIFSGVVGVLWIGARDVRMGEMSIGVLVQFVIYAVMVAGSVAALSEIWGELQRAAGASERISALIAAQDPITDPATPQRFSAPVQGRLGFEEVMFFYPSRPEQSALKALSFTVEAGETIAIVGPSGAGKSTIFQLLFRFFDPQSGQILIDGVNIKELRRADFRKYIAFVPQEPAIFAASAEDNIRFSKPEATREEIEAAACAANIHDFLVSLPKGYQTEVGEGGIMLSGGQKQRLAIARAVLRKAPILLLDEATSALDAESERAVQAAFDKMRAGRTSLTVAHRLATVKSADRILVMDNGQIVACGTHDALVEEGGLYARLAQLQFTDGTL